MRSQKYRFRFCKSVAPFCQKGWHYFWNDMIDQFVRRLTWSVPCFAMIWTPTFFMTSTGSFSIDAHHDLTARFSDFLYALDECHYRRGDRWLTIAEVQKAEMLGDGWIQWMACSGPAISWIFMSFSCLFHFFDVMFMLLSCRLHVVFMSFSLCFLVFFISLMLCSCYFHVVCMSCSCRFLCVFLSFSFLCNYFHVTCMSCSCRFHVLFFLLILFSKI